MKKTNLKAIKLFAEECQIAADEMAYQLIKEKKKTALLAAAQEYCNFNLFNSFGYLNWYNDVIFFIAKNGKQLKRKMELEEFIKFATGFRIRSIKFEIKDFEHFKKIKIQT